MVDLWHDFRRKGRCPHELAWAARLGRTQIEWSSGRSRRNEKGENMMNGWMSGSGWMGGGMWLWTVIGVLLVVLLVVAISRLSTK